MVKYFVCLIIGLFICQSCGEIIIVDNMQSQTSAKVTAVDCLGQPFNYTFDVTIESPDLGCEQYADWWEVLTRDSVLVYRRILTHSHVDEQPFARSGGIVNVGADDFVYVRAHMNNLSYGTQVFSGTARQGLVLDSLDQSFALNLEESEPLPIGCAF